VRQLGDDRCPYPIRPKDLDPTAEAVQALAEGGLMGHRDGQHYVVAGALTPHRRPEGLLDLVG
jgi:hypothetical protein